MTQRDAIQLIQAGIPVDIGASAWVDLGCGHGTFTKALANLLNPGSNILAVDQEYHTVLSPNNQVTINFQQADFTSTVLPQSLDGILMANSLHYVVDQLSFINHLTKQLNKHGRLIFIEYDTDQSNAWVPYPITFYKLKEILSQAGYTSVTKIGEIDSVYNHNKIYACAAFR
jgi:trans-aconitate methyltransferase